MLCRIQASFTLLVHLHILHVYFKLMNESEADVMRLTEQVKILKDEIRRLERNMQREKETQNLEYLKNILMKVSTVYNDGSVILKLSPKFYVHICI